MKMQKFTYKIIGPRAGVNKGISFMEFGEYGAEDFLRMIAFDLGYHENEIMILKIEDATPSEIESQKCRNKYFEQFGTACE